MVTRRGFISGLGTVGLGGAGGWAYATGNLPTEVQNLLPTSSLRVGERTSLGEFTIAVTDVATTTEAEYVVGDEAHSWKAPEGAKLALFKLEVSNGDITKHEAPALNLRNYSVLKEKPNTLSLAGVNDIRVYGNNEGAVLPEFRYQTMGIDSIAAHGRRLSTYPNGRADMGPSVGPNQTLTGWVWGLIEIDNAPGLKIQTENHSVRWQHDDVSPSLVPSENRTIEI